MDKKIIRKALPFMVALGTLFATAACDEEYNETKSNKNTNDDDGYNPSYLYYEGGFIEY